MIKKKKAFIIVILAIIFIWFSIFIIDYTRVTDRKDPVFCVTKGNGRYIGLGYEYYGGLNSISGNNEYVGYLFGFEIYNNITN